MELHAFNRKPSVAQAHDGAGAIFFGGPGADLQFCREIFFFNNQRVVASGCHWHGETLEYGSVVMHDGTRLAMHQVRGADNVAAESFANGLMSQADSEYWNLAGKVADQVDADARFIRSAGARGDHNPLGIHVFDLVHRDLIIASNFHLAAKFADVLHQVVGERIVVVEYENQIVPPVSAYRISE